MATVTRETLGTLTEKITVTVQKEDYLPAFDKAIKSYSKNVNMPGFRKGMVPAGLIRKMHGPGVFADEVLKSVEKELMSYMEKEQLNIFAQPLPSAENRASDLDMNNPGEYHFGFEIGLKPEFSVAALQSASLNVHKVIVTDEMINNEVERLQQRHGKLADQETVNSEENVLNVSFMPCDAEGHTAEDATGKDNSLLVKYFAAGTRSELMDKTVGFSLVLQLNTAFEDKEREWLFSDLALDKNDPEAGNRYFKMTINKIGLIEKRELNEEFFNEVYPGRNIATEEAFREELKKEIEAYWYSQTRNQLHDAIFHYLVDKTEISFPENFLKKWLQYGRDKAISEEEAEQEYPSFSQSLKWTLISEKLTTENALTVQPEEIKEFARKQVMSYMGMQALGGNMDWMEDYANRMMKDKKYVEDSYHRLLAEKLFYWAETQVQTNEQPISAEAFTEMMQAHKHHHH